MFQLLFSYDYWGNPSAQTSMLHPGVTKHEMLLACHESRLQSPKGFARELVTCSRLPPATPKHAVIVPIRGGAGPLTESNASESGS